MKYIIKLINDKYLRIRALTDVQFIYKNVPFEEAQLFEYEYALYCFNRLIELSKLKDWEEYIPVGIEEVIE